MKNRLVKENAGLLIVDFQERLLAHVERSCELLVAIEKVVRGCQYMGIPIIATEQYPEKMGPTAPTIQKLLDPDTDYLPKTTFSCVADSEIKRAIEKTAVNQWVVVGIEAHVCVFQTARDLKEAGYGVVVLNDAISSRSIFDYSTAIAEMRDEGIRISSVETVLFELLHDSKTSEFKQVSQLIKS